jgi:hypothetical protein
LAAGSVTQLIGCPFKKGDVAAGTWPQFQLIDGTNVPCTILHALATSWTDGSLKFVPVMLSLPQAVSGDGAVTVNILSGGTLPLPSSRRLSDFHQGISPRVVVDGLDNLSGTWHMRLKQAIESRGKIICYGNGAAGAVWKVRANARQAGVNHSQLVCDFYIASLANPDGSLKGLRILGKVKLPYYDTQAPMNWVSFSRFQLLLDHQGTLIRDCFGNNFGAQRSYTFSWAGGYTFNANHGYNTQNGGDYGYCTRLTTTGTLPTGLSPNTSYFSGTLSSSQIAFSNCAQTPGSNLVSATDGGSGTLTATPYPYLAYFGALFTAGPTGMWDFMQGAGTDSGDTTLRCQMNQSYWVSTGLIPSYDITLAPASNAPTNYWSNCSEPVTRYVSTTGERDDIGPIPSWYVRHFLTQTAVDEQVVRIVSLIGGHGFSVGLENSATKTYPCVNNGINGNGTAYRGMPTPNPGFTWAPQAISTQGFVDTTNPLVQLAGFSAQDTVHMPQFNYYPYLFTGEPWHLDMLLEHANSAVYCRWNVYGNANISETYYALGGNNGGGERILQVYASPQRYGTTIGCNEDQARDDAWASQLLAAAAAIGPDRNPDCVSYKKYFSDMNAATWGAAHDIINALPPFANRYGMWDVDYSSGCYYVDQWQLAYLGAAVAFAASATENKDARATLKVHVRYFDQLVAKFGGWHAGAYRTIVKMGDQLGSALATSESHIAFYGPTISWQSGGHFTIAPFSNYTPANGDSIIFDDTGFTPAGFRNFTPYYFVNLQGTQFDLSTKRNGTPMPLSDSYSGGNTFYIVSSKPPSTGSISGIGYPTSYNTEVLGMLSYAYAAGAPISSTTIADLSLRDKNAGINFTSDPKWAMTTSFNQFPARRRRDFLSASR